MNRIHEWYIKSYYNGVYTIKGVAEIGGSSQRIRTEPVSAVLYDRGRKLLLVTVEGGQMYTLNTDDMYMGRRCYPPKDWVDEIHSEREMAVRHFCEHFVFPELAQDIIDAKNEKIRQLEERIEHLKKTIPENTIYLALRDCGYYFHYGVYNKNGTAGHCEMHKHVDIIQVSGDDGINCSPLMGFMINSKNYVAFFSHIYELQEGQVLFREEPPVEGMLLGYLYNSGETALNVRLSWNRYIVVKPAEEVEIRYGMGSEEMPPAVAALYKNR